MRSGLMVLIYFLCSCTQSPGKEIRQEARSETAPPSSMFPVSSYLKGQLRQVESEPITLLKVTERAGRTDSTWLDRDSLSAYLQPFLETEIDSAHLAPYFHTSSFYDDDEEQYVLEYTPGSNHLPGLALKHVIVYIDAATSQVSSVYLEQEWPHLKKQLLWKTSGSCIVNTIVQKDTISSISKVKLAWHFN